MQPSDDDNLDDNIKETRQRAQNLIEDTPQSRQRAAKNVEATVERERGDSVEDETVNREERGKRIEVAPTLDEELHKQFQLRLPELQEKTGMKKVQEEIQAEAASGEKQKKRFFDRFHSTLRYFNENASTNCFKSGIIAPTINWVGRVLNFANDTDCEIVSELFTSRKEGARSAISMLGEGKTWLALGKVALSSFGAIIRTTASAVSYGLEVVFSPVRTWNNFKAAVKAAWDAPRFEGVGAFFKNVNRHYQLIEPKNPPNPEVLGAEDANTIKTLTMNAGLLRDWFWNAFKDKDKDGKPLPFNKLRRPRERALELADHILKMDQENPRDVICMQEVFDNLANMGFSKDAQKIVMDRLKERFPYILHDVGHRGYPFVGSGLIVFSKHPIVDAEFHRYPNLAGLDSLSNKGFVAAKIQKGNRFFTVYNTHTQATRGEFTKWMEVLTRKTRKLPTSGECRGEELGLLNEHMQQWAGTPPPQASRKNLKPLDTFLMGDLNQGLNDKEKVFGISHGKQKSRKHGLVKYQGQSDLMHNMSIRLADNFVDYRIHHERIHVMKNSMDDSVYEITGVQFKDGKEDGKMEDIDLDQISKWKKIEIDKEGRKVELQLSDKEINCIKSLVKDSIEKAKEKDKAQDKNKDTAGEAVNVKSPITVELFRKKGEHPTKRKMFEFERDKMIQETIQDLQRKFPKENPDVIWDKVHKHFEVLSASIINNEELIRSLKKGTDEASAPDVSAGEKYVDVNASQLFDRTDKLRERGLKAKNRTCLLFAPKGEDGRVFTDHAGMIADFSYDEDRDAGTRKPSENL